MPPLHIRLQYASCVYAYKTIMQSASRVVRIACPIDAKTEVHRFNSFLDETLVDILLEVNKNKKVLYALIIKEKEEQMLPAAVLGDIYLEFATGGLADQCILGQHSSCSYSG